MRDTNEEGVSKKQGKATTRMKLGTFLCLMFLLLYIPSLIHWIYGRSISTAIIRMGTLEESVNKNAYILRDEEPLVSRFDGRFIPEASEGDKVPAAFSVATVLNGSSVKLIDDLRQKELAIIKEQNKKNDNLELFSEDIVKLDDKIQEKVRQVAEISNSRSFRNVDEVREGINQIIEKKAEVLGGLNTSDAYINMLKKDKEKIQEQIRANTRDIATQRPGIVSYHVDGYEEILSSRALKQLTPGVLEKIDPPLPGAGKPGGAVTVNKPFAKIISGNEYYITAIMDEAEAAGFKENDSIAVRITDIDKIIYNCKIEYKSEKLDGKYIIAVKMDKYMSDTAAMRKINVDFIKSFYEGLKVPLKSLKDVDTAGKKAKIVLIKANSASIRDIKLEGWNQEFGIISGIEGDFKNSVSLYDSYAVSPENIEEGQIVTQ